MDSIQSNRSLLLLESLLPCKDVYDSRKLLASPIPVIDLLSITGILEHWTLDGVPVRILPQLIQALLA